MSETAAAVLFDMDGVLVDSEPVWYEVETDVVRRLGGVWSREHQAHCIGGTVAAACNYIRDLTGTDVPPADIAADIMAAMVTQYRTDLPVVEPAVRLLRELRARGVATALVSSSYRVLVDAALERLGPELFDTSVAGDELARGKPAPDPYLTACERLGVEPARAVVIEDAMNGVRSAEAAGCPVVVVPSVAPIEPAPGRVVVASLSELDVARLLSFVR
jgi:HAD superfamily hydrolase (TIGR01509 family)